MLKKKVDIICKTPVLENIYGINSDMYEVELPIGDIYRHIRRGNQVYEVLPNGKRVFLTRELVEADNSAIAAPEFVLDKSPVPNGRSIEAAITSSGRTKRPIATAPEVTDSPKHGAGHSGIPTGGHATGTNSESHAESSPEIPPTPTVEPTPTVGDENSASGSQPASGRGQSEGPSGKRQTHGDSTELPLPGSGGIGNDGVGSEVSSGL